MCRRSTALRPSTYQAKFAQPNDLAMLDRVVSYVRTVIAHRHADPGDGLITRLTPDGLAGTVMTLIGAGHITTIQFLGTAILRLLGSPHRAVTDWHKATNELLRLDPPSHVAEYRYAARARTSWAPGLPRVTKSCCPSPPPTGTRPASPAPTASTSPGTPALTSPCHGVHSCLGTHLVRLETEVALSTLFDTLPDLALSWSYGPTFCGPTSLEVTFTPVSGPCG